MTCIDCGHHCTPTAYRCRRCQCRETYTWTHATNHHRTKGKTMHANTINPTMGDIGEEEEVEFEPLEVPETVPVPEKVPA